MCSCTVTLLAGNAADAALVCQLRFPLTPGLHARLHTGLLLAVNLCFSVPALSRMLMLPSYRPSASSMPSAVHAMHTTLLPTCRHDISTWNKFKQKLPYDWVVSCMGAVQAQQCMCRGHATAWTADTSGAHTLCFATDFCSGDHSPKSEAVPLASCCDTGL